MKRFSSTAGSHGEAPWAHTLYRRQGPPVNPEEEQGVCTPAGKQTHPEQNPSNTDSELSCGGWNFFQSFQGVAGEREYLLSSNRRQSVGAVSSRAHHPFSTLTTHPSPGYPSPHATPFKGEILRDGEEAGSQVWRSSSLALANCYCPQLSCGHRALGPTLGN